MERPQRRMKSRSLGLAYCRRLRHSATERTTAYMSAVGADIFLSRQFYSVHFRYANMLISHEMASVARGKGTGGTIFPVKF